MGAGARAKTYLSIGRKCAKVKATMEQYRNRLFNFIVKRVEDLGVAEEITNDVLWAGMRGEKEFRGEAAVFSWLCAIAKNKIIDYYRKKKIKTVLFSVNPLFEELTDMAVTPERDVLKNELVEEIKKTFTEIGEGYGKILRLKYIDGLKVAEIARTMASSVKAIESKLIRAKAKFRQSWAYDRSTSKKNR